MFVTFLCLSFQLFAQFNACSQWTWVSGGPGATGPVYGTKGTGSTANHPGTRNAMASWTDGNGKFWLYGGGGYNTSNVNGYLNDLWKYDPSTNQWTWMQGSNQLINVKPVYGTKGIAAASNTPGGRIATATWQSADGSLWLYGGHVDYGSGLVYPNDLWKYSIATNQWTWMGGSTSANRAAAYYTALGVAAAANNPGSRSASSAWIDGAGKLWLFGGYDGAGSALNDLWKFDPVTGYWTAVQANGYASNKPAVRYHAMEWKDAQNNLWLFGGYGTTTNGNGSFSDIWKYTISTNTWTLVKGDATLRAPAFYGTQGVATVKNTPGSRYNAASWTDGKNHWIFGGYKEASNEGPYNDLWKYDPVTNNWTWVKGDTTTYAAAVYGTKGVSTTANKPGARMDVAWWTDKSSRLWVFGGYNLATQLNDLWKLDTSTTVQTTFYKDADKDGFGGTTKIVACSQPAGYVTKTGDCNDANATVYPGAPELCDGLDNNCDGIIDNGLTLKTFYRDYDKDGYGTAATTLQACAAPTGYVSASGDCNDKNAAVHPGAAEVCNGIDDNCDGLIDNGVTAVSVSSQWTWIKGGPGASDPVYGTKGVSGTSNRPGMRNAMAFWKDGNGRFWLFGGGGYNLGNVNAASAYLDDVWRFDPATSQWAWMQGSSQLVNRSPVYGTKGIAAAANTPGGRAFTATWQGNDGSFWLYGGHTLSSLGLTYPNDLWKYNPSINQWTWMGGSTSANRATAYYTALGVAAAANNPGSRSGSSSWVDGSGKLWLFGGYDGGGSALNDLWKFDPATGYWTAVQANGYASNKPAVRYHAAQWKDAQNNLWLFGGYGTTSNGNGSFSDIWKYTISTNTWTLVKGTAALAVVAQYGTQGVAAASNTPGSRYSGASWTDGKYFWFFGGYKETNSEGPYNDLWKYDPVTNNWTWMKGDKTTYAGSVYGTKGVAASANKPGGRWSVAAWRDNGNNLWLFGGYNNTTQYNELWKLATNTGVQTTYYQDYDKDGFGNAAVKITTTCAAPPGYVINNTDCNDRNAAINPAHAEVPGNGIDDDCDGVKDEAALTSTVASMNARQNKIGEPANKLSVTAAPNPTNTSFILSINGSNAQPVQLRVFDELGRDVESKRNITANNVYSIGGSFRAGVYYAEVMQDGQKVTLKLVKLPAGF